MENSDGGRSRGVAKLNCGRGCFSLIKRRGIWCTELFIELTVIASYPLPLAPNLDHIAAYQGGESGWDVTDTQLHLGKNEVAERIGPKFSRCLHYAAEIKI